MTAPAGTGVAMRGALPWNPAAVAPLLVGAMIGSLVAGRLEPAALCAAVALATAAAVGAPRPSTRWLATLGAGAAFAWLLNVYLTPGTALHAWPTLLGRAATREGLGLGALLTLRLAGAFAAVQGLARVWPGERAADEAARWLAPLERVRVPVREMRVMLGLAIRFAPLLRQESARIARVQALRAGRPPRGIGERLRHARAAAVPTLVGALERAERVALALEARHVGLGRLDEAPGARRGSWTWRLLGGAVVATALLWR